MSFTKPKNLAEEIADHIGARIIRMELKPGQRLVEYKIAGELSVSRGPVREAMRILERYRLVEIHQQKGCGVTKLDARYAGWLEDILVNLAGLTVRLCSQNAVPDDFSRLFEIAGDMDRCAARKDNAGFFQAAYDFAVAALEASGNLLLQEMVRDALPSAQRALYLCITHGEHDFFSTTKVFHDLLESLKQKDPETASNILAIAMKKEFSRVKEIILHLQKGAVS